MSSRSYLGYFYNFIIFDLQRKTIEFEDMCHEINVNKISVLYKLKNIFKQVLIFLRLRKKTLNYSYFDNAQIRL